VYLNILWHKTRTLPIVSCTVTCELSLALKFETCGATYEHLLRFVERNSVNYLKVKCEATLTLQQIIFIGVICCASGLV